MRRLHLIEIAEQPWCPRAVRDGLTDYLRFVIDAGGAYAAAAPILVELLRHAGTHRVLDLCAGGGGPWRSLVPALVRQGVHPEVRLTDRYPNAEAFAVMERELPGIVRGERRPVDALAVPPELPGVRTIFSALHHFRPEGARALLADAAEHGITVAAFEATRRDAKAILLTLLTPLIVLLVTPRIRPFRWSRLLWTYLLPAIPLVVLLDGVVSCLRTYTVEELRELTEGLGSPGYRWSAGETGDGPIPVTYLTGELRAGPMAAVAS